MKASFGYVNHLAVMACFIAYEKWVQIKIVCLNLAYKLPYKLHPMRGLQSQTKAFIVVS